MDHEQATLLLGQLNRTNLSDMPYSTRQALCDTLESDIVALGYSVRWGIMGGNLVARFW